MRTTRRGDPLLLLSLLLAGWVGVRVVMWQSPFDIRGTRPALAAIPIPIGQARLPEQDRQAATSDIDTAMIQPSFRGREPRAFGEEGDRVLRQPGSPSTNWRQLDQPLPGLSQMPLRAIQRASEAEGQPLPATMVVGHTLLTTMGLSQMTLSPVMAAYVDAARRSMLHAWQVREAGIPAAARGTDALGTRSASSPRVKRWTGDAWLLVRDGNTAPLLLGQPSYGRSQAGAVLRYRLAPSSRQRPQLYVRASGALESPRDVEVAGGLSARPLTKVPVRVAAELRVANTQGGTDLRPSAYAVSEFPPLDLPLGARGELYLQAGYVAGDFATGFVDGQARAVRDVASIGNASVSTGAGVWGGAQKGASRLDVGPSAFVSFRLGKVNARLAVDYRVRVAGDAEPASGPALTLAAGF